MVLRYLPPLEYTITRPFGSAGLTATAYTLGFISCVVICIVNVALVGYDPTTVFRSNFNATQSFWFDRFIPNFLSQTAGTLCDEHVFNVGDSLVTNVSLFEWKVDGVYRPNAGESGFSYNGRTLDKCDVSQIALSADVRTWSLEVTMYMWCGTPLNGTAHDRLEIAGVTTFGVSGLPARQTDFQRMAKSAAQDSAAWTNGRLLVLAGIDIGRRLWEAYLASNNTGVVAYSAFADFEFCPPSFAFPSDGSPPHPCALSTPQIRSFAAATTISANNSLSPPATILLVMSDNEPQAELDDIIRLPTSNFIQIAYAAARIDLGNTAPNNFLTNPELMDSALHSEFPETELTTTSSSVAFAAWKSQMDPVAQVAYPRLEVPGPSTLQAVFICHFVKLKSTGSLIVTVLVATLSMFSTAWGLLLFFAAYFVKSGVKGNCCGGHESGEFQRSGLYFSGEKGNGTDVDDGSNAMPSAAGDGDPDSAVTPNSPAVSKMHWAPLLQPSRQRDRGD